MVSAMRAFGNHATTKRYDQTLRYLNRHARRQMRLADRKRQKQTTGGLVEDWTVKKTIYTDPMMWSNVVAADVAPRSPPPLHINVIDGDDAEVSVAGGFVVRYAGAGCFASDDSFKVNRTSGNVRNGQWRIKALPAGLFAGTREEDHCDAEQLAASWGPAPNARRGIFVSDTEHLPAWTGDRLQRATPSPTDASAEPPTATAAPRPSDPTTPDEAIDPENRSRPADITAWRTQRGAAEGSELVIDLGVPIRLARIRLHNGAGGRWRSDQLTAAYLGHGRVAAATIITEDTQATVQLPDVPELVTVDCDFGVTQKVRIRVEAVFPAAGSPAADSDVALSDVGLYGQPPGAKPAPGAPAIPASDNGCVSPYVH
jgi:hypothetical protein